MAETVCSCLAGCMLPVAGGVGAALLPCAATVAAAAVVGGTCAAGGAAGVTCDG